MSMSSKSKCHSIVRATLTNIFTIEINLEDLMFYLNSQGKYVHPFDQETSVIMRLVSSFSESSPYSF
jgi:hypothetical protein